MLRCDAGHGSEATSCRYCPHTNLLSKSSGRRGDAADSHQGWRSMIQTRHDDQYRAIPSRCGDRDKGSTIRPWPRVLDFLGRSPLAPKETRMRCLIGLTLFLVLYFGGCKLLGEIVCASTIANDPRHSATTGRIAKVDFLKKYHALIAVGAGSVALLGCGLPTLLAGRAPREPWDDTAAMSRTSNCYRGR